MYIIIWEYRVTTEKKTEFEKVYSHKGAWADLFRKAAGYLGSELMRDEAQSEHFLTIDRWDSKEGYEAFQSQWKTEYETLDIQCEGLTESESLLGKWISI